MSDPNFSDEYDDFSDGIRVNMTAKEGESQAFELIPAGFYLVNVTDVELKRASGDSKPENKGKPMFNLEFTIQEGKYEGRHLWDLVMLWSPALYTMVHMLKAQGIEVRTVGESAEFHVPGFNPNVIPGAEWWMAKQFTVKTKVEPERTDKRTGKTYQERAKIVSYKSASEWKGGAPVTATAEKPRASLLP